jgi:amino acid adenylation domain-containing protein
MEAFLLHDLLRRTAEASPQKTALVFREKELTYAELDLASDNLAFFLIQSGTKIGDRVGILLNKCPESIISIFGILKTGAAYVPIDPQIPVQRTKFIIENCEIQTLITSSAHLKRLYSENSSDAPKLAHIVLADGAPDRSVPKNVASSTISLKSLYSETPRELVPVKLSDANPAYILYTSGSTGVPKGVVLSHLNALTFVNMASTFFGLTDKDRFGSHAPLHFDLSVFDIYVAIKWGATIVLVPEFLSAFPLRLVEYIYEKKISVWNSVSSVLVLLASRGNLERFKFDFMHLVHFSGDVLPIKYLRVYKELMPEADFYNIYGQTEANSSLHYHVADIPDDHVRQIPIGKPFPNFEVFAIGDDDQVVSKPGQDGELYIKSSTLAAGYWRDAKLTMEKFVPDPRAPNSQVRVYKTGDVVKIGSDGSYYFVGRKDHMVKSRGYRIELPEVEHILASHPLVRHVAVIAVPDELIGHKIMAYVSLIEGEHCEVQEILAFCGSYLPKYMVPEIIEFRDSLPMTSSGKIDRKSLTNEALSKYGR